MKDKLKQITNSTLNELLNKEVILPSSYFECFDKHAKTLDIELNNTDFEKELSELILEEYNTINEYVNNAVESIDMAANLTKDAQEAIKQNNTLALKNLYEQIRVLQNELEDITKNVYTDYLTKIHNKKWLYHKGLSKEANFKEDSLFILINVNDYDYITQTYNKLIANNLLIFVTKYIQEKFKEESIDFQLVRYLNNKFVIMIKNDEASNIKLILNNIKTYLISTTLKSNSGVIIKPSFNFSMSKVKKEDSFHSCLEILLKNIQ